MAIKLVISDIDGTLVQHLPHANNLASADALIPQTAIDAISLLHSKGVIIAGVTGRTFEQSKDILTRLGITGPCVFAGGAIIRNLPDGEVLYEANLTDESIMAVKAILSKYLADGRSIELNPSSLDPTQYNSIWAKLRKSDTEAIKQELSRIPNIYFVMNDGHGHKAEFGVACVGDGANDVPMFNECGLGIAMGNGADELKSVAHYVVAPIQQDGFAEATRIILEENIDSSQRVR